MRGEPEAVIPRSENERALAWLDECLEYARDGDLASLKRLLEAVREEVLFELGHAGGTPDGRLSGDG